MFSAIEKGIQDWLRAASQTATGVLPYRYGTIETYPLDWEEHLVSGPVTYPAAFVTFAGFRTREQTSAGAQIVATFGLALAQKNLRLGAARAGGPLSTEIGTVKLQEDAVRLLQGCDFGLDIDGLEVVSGEEPDLSDALVRAGISIFALQFQTRFTLDIDAFDPSAEFMGVFKTLQAEFAIADGDQTDLFSTTQTLQED